MLMLFFVLALFLYIFVQSINKQEKMNFQIILTDEEFQHFYICTTAAAEQIYNEVKRYELEKTPIHYINETTGETINHKNIHEKLNQIMEKNNLPKGFKVIEINDKIETEKLPRWDWNASPRFIGKYVDTIEIPEDAAGKYKAFKLIVMEESEGQQYVFRANVELLKIVNNPMVQAKKNVCIQFEGKENLSGGRTISRFSLAVQM